MLCVGGPIKYKLKRHAVVGRQFLREVVMPKTFEFFQDDESSKFLLVRPMLFLF